MMSVTNGYIVDDLIQFLYDNESDIAYNVTLIDGSTLSLMTTNELLQHMSIMFGSYTFYPASFITGQIPQNFREIWDMWLLRNNHNIARQIDALTREYNPINNYDLTEQAADGTRVSQTTTTNTPSGEMTTQSTHSGTDTTTDSRYGFDSGVAVPADQSSMTHGETITDKTSFNAYKTDNVTHSDNDQSITLPDGTAANGFDTGSEHYLRRFGNIGVQTAADIIGGELAVRVHDVAIEWLKKFADQYCVYVG